MRIRVMKFGGTSVAIAPQRRMVADRIQKALSEGYMPVVVVSAMGRYGDPYATDTLLGLATDGKAEPLHRDLALLGACGEIISSAVVSSTLQAAGIRAVALTGPQAGVRTVGGHMSAVIVSVDPAPIECWIQAGIVPVIAGFQGMSEEGDVTILARGGSDISATALGHALDSAAVDVFTDVPGIMTADPRVVPEARLIPHMTYDQAYLLARHGAKVVHPDALGWAALKSIPVYVRSTWELDSGTCITGASHVAPSGMPIGVAARPAENGTAQVTLVRPQRMGAGLFSRVRAALREERLAVTAISETPETVSVTVPLSDMQRSACLLHDRFVGNIVGNPTSVAE